MSEVTYRPIPGFEGYRVGDDGTIWSRRVPVSYQPGKLRDTWKRIEGVLDNGYRRAGLRDARRVRVMRGVHQFVLAAFVGPQPDGMVCRHLNGDGLDNRLSNLCYGTCQENTDDRARHGTMARGERIASSKLTEAEVRAIRAERAAGVLLRVVAAKYHVTTTCVHLIEKRKHWAHVKP